MTLEGLADGDYEIQWWDTYTGQLTQRDNATARAGKIALQIGELTKDVACRVMRK